ncbi:MAG TPA: bifunctional UDP-N-acetylglucosamine diphosphorylase/glucosamine-1-phosphate N-acetyltransferase GlmU [bacterium]|nr:bifunctional UDP-N-acetylglucosamine diphosphorylase/glucosamine-1-phosphate N-acetyltransferase GlmU [bacterium]
MAHAARTEQTAAVVLAAGKGTRMRSDLPKMLHPLRGRPMVAYAVDALRQAGVRRPIVVVGPGHRPVQDALGDGVAFVVQREPRGSGHALLQAMPRLRGRAVAFVVNGDMPLVSPDTLRALRRRVREGAAAAIASGTPGVTPPYGRIVRAADGRFLRIVEHVDATPEEAAIREVNAGFYCVRVAEIAQALRHVRPANRQGEYYLPDAVNVLAAQGRDVEVVPVTDPEELAGVNTRAELSAVDAILRRRVLERLMAAGVTVLDPATTFVDDTVKVGRDAVLHPGTFLTGRTVIGPECIVGPGAHVHASVLGPRVRVWDSWVEESRIGKGTTVGPFAHLRPGTVIGRDVEIGNFAELKNSRIGDRTKVHHKSYLGDAQIGVEVNIGAGTITCNYGFDRRKHRTTIGDRAYIGSDSMLVAPVRIGREAATGAGSVVTKDVPPRRMAVGVPARIIRSLNGRR